jgi:hypothetical protein
MLKYKVLIFLAVWKRPEITEICFMGLERLRKKFGVQAFAVISEEPMIPLCEKYGVDWCMHENDPLGTKKNFGLTQAMKKDFDFMIEIGSDDLLKDGIFELYPFDRDVMALKDFIMINSEDGECRRLRDRDANFGLGRAISRKALESCKCKDGVYRLWGERHSHGLDNNSTFRLAGKGFLEKRYASAEPLAIDIKSAVNIWPFQKIGTEYDFDKAMDGLGENEIEAIKSLAYVTS